VSYPAIPDMRMPFHRDGTVVGTRPSTVTAADFAQGLTAYLTQTQLQAFQDTDWTLPAGLPSNSYSLYNEPNVYFGYTWMFFPESREVTAMFLGYGAPDLPLTYFVLQGSSDSTNGVDGTWETASQPNGAPVGRESLDSWRSGIKAISFTGGKRTIRFATRLDSAPSSTSVRMIHLYGRKATGQTPDDLIFIDHDTTPGVEYAAAEDFANRPLGTTVVRQFRVKNASATKTANTINIQCNDSDFVISTDNATWVVTINIGSLAALAESATMYIRNTTPAPGSLLGPRFAEVVAIVGSWT
jgi:hypothetical protein